MTLFRVMLFGTLALAPILSSAQSQPPTSCFSTAEATEPPSGAIAAIDTHVQELRRASFPEIAGIDLRVGSFRSDSDYFRTRFSLLRFLLPLRMRYFVEVNPALFSLRPPSDGVCSVLAHELSHVVALSHGNRLRRFGLVRLLSSSYTAKFERRTDLEALHRGYGEGLKSYRTWVYAHIPARALAAKRRNYFSPEEIDAIQERLRNDGNMFEYWSKHVPLNLDDIRAGDP